MKEETTCEWCGFAIMLDEEKHKHCGCCLNGGCDPLPSPAWQESAADPYGARFMVPWWKRY
jgi:hypothetical protein